MPIKQKMTLVILVTCSVVVLLACAAMGGYQIFQFRTRLMRETTVLADVLANNTQAALAFRNENDAKETLRALEAEPYVNSACLYSSDGMLFADYSQLQGKATFPDEPPADGSHFESSSMVVVRPVMLNKKRIGTIFIRASLQEIYDRVKFLGVFTGLVLLGCGLVARTLAVRLQRSISQPIVNLTEAVRALAERSDYTVRLPEQGRNETGSLTAAFNHLLASIGERDKALRGANQSLCQSEAQVQAILENLNDGLIISDLTGQVTSFNRAAMEMHGFTCMHECQQLSEYAKTFELSDLDGTLCPVEQWPLARILRGERLRNLEVKIRHSQGGWRKVFNFGGALIHDSNGQPINAVLTVTDITERHQAQEEIHQLNSQLEIRVQERTRQLEEANKELESFSYSVSHDLRAPLRHVQGYVQLLTVATNGHLSTEAREHLQVISDASDDMGHLIDDLLSFSRTGRTELKTERVRLDELAQESIRVLELANRDRNIVWKIEALPAVLGDRAMLRQVFANLVGNAVKYSRPRDPAVIEIGCAGDEGGRAMLFVRDNGVGFNMKYLPKLFGVFQRLHKASEFEGTGIGLAIVQRIIHRHGGSIRAEAALNQGATFYFTLKLAAPEQALTGRNDELCLA